MAKYKKRRCYCTSCRGQKKRSRVSIWRHKKSDAEEEKKELDQEIADEIKMEETAARMEMEGLSGLSGLKSTRIIPMILLIPSSRTHCL